MNRRELDSRIVGIFNSWKQGDINDSTFAAWMEILLNSLKEKDTGMKENSNE